MITGDEVKDLIDEVREEIGRTVVFHVPNSHSDLTGLYNPVTDTRYQLTTTTHEVLARIHWTNDEAITASPGGKYFMGECSLVIDPSYLTIAQGTQQEGGKVVVDGHDMQITKIIPVGVITINRLRLILAGSGERQ